MSRAPNARVLLHVAGVLVALLLLGQVPAAGQAAPPVDAGDEVERIDAHAQPQPAWEGTVPIRPASPSACPAGPVDLPEEIERTNFCVYYTTDSISHAEATWAADWVEDYWDRFTSLGFNAPKHSGLLEVRLLDIPDDCNGGTAWGWNYMTTYAGCFDTDELAQKVLGHELTHRVQYSHDSGASAPVQTKFLKEGTARASEDNWFLNIDQWPAALSFSSFNSQVNNYLLDTNRDITSVPMRYNSCLWWKYASEQYGTIATEPERGVDFFLEVYDQNTAGHSGVSAVNNALSSMGTGTNFHGSFRRFAVAIWTKDLTGVPDGSYYFTDEDEAGNPAPYGPVDPEDGGTIEVGVDASWGADWVTKYGLRYYEANIGVNCPLVSATFDRNSGGPGFYHVVTQDGNAFDTHVESSGDEWIQAFLNDGITKIVAIVGSLENGSSVDVSLACANPVIEIKMPNSVAVAYVTSSSHVLAQVLVTNGSPTGPVVAGLTNDDFSAQVGGTDATVVNGGFIQEQYWLVIEAPPLELGTYDLEITLEEPGTGTPIASDISAGSVVYDEDNTDQVLVIDRSGSMGTNGGEKMEAAQEAANFYVDVTRDDDGLGIVPYNEDVDPAPFDLVEVDATVRSDAETYIDDISDGGWTSIGDGLREAVDQRGSSPTGNPRCSFVLLSDGMENADARWADVITDVVDIGCPVTAIAFGPESDETLMQDIATATGGAFFYNDVYVSTAVSAMTPGALTPAQMALALDDVYEYAEGLGEGRQRLLQEEGAVSANSPTAFHQVFVDDTVVEAVFALDWFSKAYARLNLTLVRPDGGVIGPPYTFEDEANGHVGWRWVKPQPGLWTLIVEYVGSEIGSVDYQVLVSAHSKATLHLLLPDRLGSRYYTGNRVPIYAFFSASEPIAGAEVRARVTAPDGTTTIVPLYDDGEHGDGGRDDGFYAGLYTLVNQADVVYPEGEEDQPTPNDEGAYRVRVRATRGNIQREALGGFSVQESPDNNGNRMPDAYEEEYGISDPSDDTDGDSLNNGQEYYYGTNPNDSDTDDGGENDGSEVFWGRDPLNPIDDALEGPDYLEVLPWYGGIVRLRYDVRPSYKAMIFRRISPVVSTQSAGPSGPPGEVMGELPLTGAYTDTSTASGGMYTYQVFGVDQGGAASSLLSSGEVEAAEDPVSPEALVIVDGGAASTEDLEVTVSLSPYEQEGEELANFEDIAKVLLSNDPSFSGATWEDVADPSTFETLWQLEANLGEVAQVYARFRDDAEPPNESEGTEVGMILYAGQRVYLPLVIRGS